MNSVKELNKKLYKKEILTLTKKIERIYKAIETNDQKLAKLNVDLLELEKELEELKNLEHSYK